MKQIIVNVSLLVTLFVSCSRSRSTESITFQHKLFSLTYPASWQQLDNEDMLLVIAKNSKLGALMTGENASVVVIAIDSILTTAYGYNGLSDYVEGFKQKQASQPGYILLGDTKKVRINRTDLLQIHYKVNHAIEIIQTQYFFKSLSQYVSIIVTYPKGYFKSDTDYIVQSLEVPKFQPLEQILESAQQQATQ